MDNSWLYSAFAPSTWSNWVLALFAAGATVIALRTLKAVRNQVEIANKGLTRLERAWIMVVPQGFKIDPQGGTANTPRSITFSWIVKNVGRSPAWITGGIAKVKKIHEASLPTIPDYGDPGSYSLTPTPPDEKGREESVRIDFIADEYRALTEGRLNPIVYGFMTYRDVLGDEEHETRFCLCLGSGSSGISVSFCGAEAYNRYT